MTETSSAGEMPVPAPVRFEVNDADVALMWRAVARQRYGVASPAFLAIGLLDLVVSVLSLLRSANGYTWATLLAGICFVVLAFAKSSMSTGVLRPTDLRFTATGLDVEVAFAPPPQRRYAWTSIRRIDDIGDSFVLVPKFGRRVVFPKRAFPDRGCGAWSVFAAHGIGGRVPAPESQVLVRS